MPRQHPRGDALRGGRHAGVRGTVVRGRRRRRVAGRAPVVDFDRRDDLQTRWLRDSDADPARPPRHYVPASNDFATAVRLGLGWALLPTFQSREALARGELVTVGGDPVDVPLYWQQWNLRSELLDAVADEIVAEGRRVLAPVEAVSRR